MNPEKIPLEKLYRENLAEINAMQSDQMKDLKNPLTWPAENAQRFREIILENPWLIEQYRQNPHAVRQFIAEALKKPKEVEH